MLDVCSGERDILFEEGRRCFLKDWWRQGRRVYRRLRRLVSYGTGVSRRCYLLLWGGEGSEGGSKQQRPATCAKESH
jgi:hypothetical protein